MTEQAPEPENEENERSTQYRKWDFSLPVLVPVLEMGRPFPVLVHCAFGYLHTYGSVSTMVTIMGKIVKPAQLARDLFIGEYSIVKRDTLKTQPHSLNVDN